MDTFSPLQNDVLTEAFNLGMGLAASSLSQMVGEEIKLSVPDISYIERKVAADKLAESNVVNVSGVKQGFNGPFSGDALLLFPVEKSLSIVQLLLKDTVPVDDLTELQEEALCEVGNIILNAGLASIANMFDQEITSELPIFTQGHSIDVMRAREDDSNVFFMQVDFSIQSQDINGYVIYLLDTESINDLMQSINKYMVNAGIIEEAVS